jgi:hypothetical protein
VGCFFDEIENEASNWTVKESNVQTEWCARKEIKDDIAGVRPPGLEQHGHESCTLRQGATT